MQCRMYQNCSAGFSRSHGTAPGLCGEVPSTGLLSLMSLMTRLPIDCRIDAERTRCLHHNCRMLMRVASRSALAQSPPCDHIERVEGASVERRNQDDGESDGIELGVCKHPCRVPACLQPQIAEYEGHWEQLERRERAFTWDVGQREDHCRDEERGYWTDPPAECALDQTPEEDLLDDRRADDGEQDQYGPSGKSLRRDSKHRLRE